MFDPAFSYRQSRATEPLFYRAEHPPGMTPHGYQHAGAEYALARDHCLIGDEPGLGKTAQAILICNAIKPNRTLVVCPASLRRNWEREIKRWSTIPARELSIYVVKKQADGINGDCDFVIISYDLLSRPPLLARIMSLHWDHVILDEAHAIKDPAGNKRSKTICAPNLLPSVTGRFTLLSGTILPNQPVECYNAVRLLNWDAIDRASLEDFKEKYYDLGGGMVRGPVWDEKLKANISKVHWSDRVRNVPRNMDDLQRRLRSNIMVRRLKIDVADQLPRKEFHLVPLETTAQMRLALKHPGWSAAEQLYDLDPDAFHSDMPVDGAVSTARRLLGEAKVGPACDYVEELLASGVTKLVVSAHHSSVLAVARERLSKFGLAYMDGKTSTDARDKSVQAFQSDPKIRVILGQTQVIGEGHTLTAAQDVCLLEPDYVPGRITQMVDRIHRLGQEGDYVLAHLPIVPGTLDERIVATAIEKDKTIYLALDAE